MHILIFKGLRIKFVHDIEIPRKEYIQLCEDIIYSITRLYDDCAFSESDSTMIDDVAYFRSVNLVYQRLMDNFGKRYRNITKLYRKFIKRLIEEHLTFFRLMTEGIIKDNNLQIEDAAYLNLLFDILDPVFSHIGFSIRLV